MNIVVRSAILSVILSLTLFGGCVSQKEEFQKEKFVDVVIVTLGKDLDSDGCYDAFEIALIFIKEDKQGNRVGSLTDNVSASAEISIYSVIPDSRPKQQDQLLYKDSFYFDNVADARFIVQFDYIDFDFQSYELDGFIVCARVAIDNARLSYCEYPPWSGLCGHELAIVIKKHMIL